MVDLKEAAVLDKIYELYQTRKRYKKSSELELDKTFGVVKDNIPEALIKNKRFFHRKTTSQRSLNLL